ncbi:T9SS type A sorting domain-containing protein [Flavobacterium sp.]|uniref:T9SS type A sorting domain-containing protein n=1 Tax=Flavobacterium sp. TaxID=239 RepID=UPI002632BA54|nr:T9SS type A sorting domain-containing protein [Flavobacterium sp.]
MKIVNNALKNFHYKKILPFAATVLFLIFSGKISAQITLIPDVNFENALITLGLDTSPANGSVPTANISGVLSLDVHGNNIDDLAGIEDFTSLTYLDCSENNIYSLDVSSLISLQYLDCFSNDLHSLDVTNLTNLEELYAGDNFYLDELNISDLTNLIRINVNACTISELDFTGLTNLEFINCAVTSITSLDLSDQINLTFLDIADNDLATINLSANVNLVSIDYQNTEISSLDFSGLINLEFISCSYTNTLSLDLSDQIHLTTLYCDHNLLTSLSMAENDELEILNCSYNSLTDLDLSGLFDLDNLNCSHNNFYTLDLLFLNLVTLDATQNPYLTCIAIDDPAAANSNTGFHKDSIATYWATLCFITKVQTVQCGATVASFDTYIYAVPVLTATSYMFEISYGGNTWTVTRPENKFKFLQVSGGVIRYSTNYSIRVKVLIDGVWQLYGIACNVATPIAPLTQVKSTDCGITTTDLNYTVSCNSVVGVDGYKFKIVCSAGTQEIEPISSTPLSFKLTQLNSTMRAYGRIYSISVATKNNGIYGDYGDTCNLETASYSPLVQVKTEQCNATLATIDSKINCGIPPLVEGYKFHISDGTVSEDIETSNAFIYIVNLTTVPKAYSKTYTISVATKVLGSFGSFGNTCTVTTPSVPYTQVISSQCGNTLPLLTTKVVCTPVTLAQEYHFRVTYLGADYDAYTTDNRLSLSALSVGTGYSRAYSVKVEVKVNGVYGGFGATCNVSTPAAPRMPLQLNPTALNQNSLIKGYPNPFTNSFALHSDAKMSADLHVTVFDMNGQNLDSIWVKSDEMDSLTIGNNYAVGIYSVVVTNGEETKSFLMIKK